ncbi:hypothetical protein [Acetobacter persici]|uniref:hypothetical protein n=1 Tax=Acetobacter persici TaxID=1076596 RepID=UPI001FD51906|nr:hypothetical protein [Acetobacter persici]
MNKGAVFLVVRCGQSKHICEIQSSSESIFINCTIWCELRCSKSRLNFYLDPFDRTLDRLFLDVGMTCWRLEIAMGRSLPIMIRSSPRLLHIGQMTTVLPFRDDIRIARDHGNALPQADRTLAQLNDASTIFAGG